MSIAHLIYSLTVVMTILSSLALADALNDILISSSSEDKQITQMVLKHLEEIHGTSPIHVIIDSEVEIINSIITCVKI